MDDPSFRQGFADARAGRFDDRYTFDDGDRRDCWGYERGRQLAALCPRSVPLLIKGQLNSKAVQLLDRAFNRGDILPR